MSSKFEPSEHNFCYIPFTSFVVRPEGKVVVCSEGQRPIGPWEQTQKNPEGQYLSTHSLEEIWNGEWFSDFRVGKAKGEHDPNCHTCYQEDSWSDNKGSKRGWWIDRYAPDDLEKVKEEAIQNNGKVSTMPWHWELRLSNTCNAQCVMCGPQNSSKIASEIMMNQDNPLLPLDFKARHDRHKLFPQTRQKKEDLLKTFKDNIKYCTLLELHGGEPWADPAVTDLLKYISETEYAKNISIRTFSNCTLLTKEKVEVLNKFKGGEFMCSIDAVGKESEFVRYPLTWEDTERGLNIICDNLKSEFKVKTLSVFHLFNIASLDKTFNELLKYKRIGITQAPVSRPLYLSSRLLPLDMRLEFSQKLDPFKNEEQLVKYNTVKSLQSHLSMPYEKLASVERMSINEYGQYREKIIKQFIAYYKYLDNVRNQNTLEMFPHIKEFLDNE